MPNDFTLYPSIPNPQQQQIQRTASLEARVAALEAKRDIVITPIEEVTANGNAFGGAIGTMNFPWYGGRMWISVGGRFYTNGTFTSGPVIADVRINNSALIPFPIMGWGTTNAGGVLGLTSYEAPTNMTRDYNNQLTVRIQSSQMSSVDRLMLNGLMIEWPQA